jgi:hypothetical protein
MPCAGRCGPGSVSCYYDCLGMLSPHAGRAARAVHVTMSIEAPRAGASLCNTRLLRYVDAVLRTADTALPSSSARDRTCSASWDTPETVPPGAGRSAARTAAARAWSVRRTVKDDGRDGPQATGESAMMDLLVRYYSAGVSWRDAPEGARHPLLLSTSFPEIFIEKSCPRTPYGDARDNATRRRS